MTDHDLIEAMRVQRAQLEPSTEEIRRMRTAATATFSSPPHRPRVLPAGHRRVRVSLAAVAAVAVAIAAAFAFGPGDDAGHRAVPLPAPATAKAALTQAGAAAAGAPWTPLGPGAYFHTVSSTFDPRIPSRPADPAGQVAGMYQFSQNGTTEQWLDVDGRGRSIRTDGSIGNPALFVGLTRDRTTRLITGYAGYVTREGRHVNNPPRRPVADQLRYPDSVAVVDRPRGTSKDTRTTWWRQPKGYVADGAYAYRRPGLPGDTSTVQAQVETWGASLADLQHLDELRGSQLRSAVRTLLNQKDPNILDYPFPGSYDVTASSRASGIRVRRAIKLLGSAPLAPAARQELFRVLAAEPHATLTKSAEDELGRTGTRVTFETVYDRDLPAHRITGAAAWRLAGGTGPMPSTIKPFYDLPANHAFRRWYVEVIFDRTSGELLQYAYYSRWRNSGRTPRLIRPGQGAAGIRFGTGESQGEIDSGLFGERERVTQLKPSAPVCGVEPRPCEPSTKLLPGG